MARPLPRRTKIGPKSRVQPRFVGNRRKSTRARSTPAFLRIRVACPTPECASMRTVSARVRTRTVSAYTQGIGENFPGQSVTLCGQPIQVAACGSRSAGMRRALVSQKPVLNAAGGVGAAIAQERPVAADLFDSPEIDLCQDRRLFFSGLGDEDAERVAHERMAPELDAGSLAAEPLVADAIHRGDPAAVRDRVASLDRLPGVELLRAVLRLLRRMPADCRRVQQNVRALPRREPRAFGIALIPPHQRADRPDLGVERAKAEVAWCEIEFFVIGVIVGDVHTAVDR